LPSAADLAGWALAAQHPLTREWADDGNRLARLAQDHEFDLRLATDLELAAKRAVLAPGHHPVELLNQWVAVSADLSAMLSIGFEGGDATKPFVDASALSRPPPHTVIYPRWTRPPYRPSGRSRPATCGSGARHPPTPSPGPRATGASSPPR
jgi:hypothetical protein